jgi:hypothetical protein
VPSFIASKLCSHRLIPQGKLRHWYNGQAHARRLIWHFNGELLPDV